ncbi:cytochrome c biogenesis protein CcsA [Cyclobacterium sp.]|uniref:cytochrome c biogenesis protein CcsA n=1 Tax=Cyclobacterium sp. TaxID=1966343 RepID=UPI0019B08ABC|nr:cytochrome c biogenesis protein CcsA [Cyclobacterium sp.]MBD3627554.1 cytochrome c biogenesis protein CcsA [Cyclobacterium sp.]
MKYFSYLFSTKVSLLLLILFAGSMGVATFIENDHGTKVARGLVYEAWWFEILMVWLGFCFISHIQKYRLFHRNRWPIGMFHMAFILIITGAGVTRYFSVEGTMHIREGEAENTLYTTSHYLQLRQLDEGQVFEKPLQFIAQNFDAEDFPVNFPQSPELIVRLQRYIGGAREVFEKGEETYIDMAVAVGKGREDYKLKQGGEILLNNMVLSSAKNCQSPICIGKNEEGWFIKTKVHLQIMEMSNQQMGALHEGEQAPLQLRSLYQWDGGAFMIKKIEENVRLDYQPEPNPELAKNLPDYIAFSVMNKENEPIQSGFIKLVSMEPTWFPFEFEGEKYSFTYGPKAIELPFQLYLNAFELERYPGSQSPSSYASEVMVMDKEREFPYRIYMNNVLDYKGYRFYQSSYDNDEQGTILSVNQDRPGTLITYLGYGLLALGMFLTLFAKGSRFQLLNKKLTTLKKRGVLVLLLFSISQLIHAQHNQQVESLLVPKEKADAYGRLIVQDIDGRMKPLNTLAHEISRKLSGKSYFSIEGEISDLQLTPEQFLLAVQLNPELMSRSPVIKIDPKKARQVFEILNVSPDEKISFRDFINEEGAYLLNEMVERANRLKPAERNESDKELLKIDERFNIFYALLTGDFLRIYPNKLDADQTWYTSNEFNQGFTAEDARFVKNIGQLYLSGLQTGLQNGEWQEAEEALSYIALYQKEAGKEVYPSEKLIQAELLYNQLNLGTRLFGPFWLLGALMLILGILQLFWQQKIMQTLWKVGQVFAWTGWILFTFHLALRWYIAQHPPWSDGFEMLVFVAWGILFFSLIFSGKSKFTIPLGLLFSGTLLFVGFLDWLNPEITNLMPVLHSYWLKIHVAIIVSSYAPLALAAIMALLALLLMIFKPKQPKERWWNSLLELNIVNELALTSGLFLLAIGTFLGGVWANESWGRYWAWDPKETWALISVIVYAFVLHLRLVPALKNALVYNLASLWAFSSIIMTSFGVNYYLSGLHSYAAGDPVPVPQWVFVVVAVLIVISIFAIISFKRWKEVDRKKIVI